MQILASDWNSAQAPGRWIATYGGEEFGKIVADVLALARVGESASAAEHAAMREHVVTTSRYEWMFWDAGWRRKSWPVLIARERGALGLARRRGRTPRAARKWRSVSATVDRLARAADLGEGAG